MGHMKGRVFSPPPVSTLLLVLLVSEVVACCRCCRAQGMCAQGEEHGEQVSKSTACGPLALLGSHGSNPPTEAVTSTSFQIGGGWKRYSQLAGKGG